MEREIGEIYGHGETSESQLRRDYTPIGSEGLQALEELSAAKHPRSDQRSDRRRRWRECVAGFLERRGCPRKINAVRTPFCGHSADTLFMVP